MKKQYSPASLVPPEQPQEQPQSKQGLPPNFDAQVKQFLVNGMKLLHSPEMRENTEAMLSQQKDPVVGLKDVALNIINVIEDKARQKNININPLVVAKAGPEIFAQIAEIGEESGILVADEKQKTVALGAAVQEYIEKAKNEGRVTDEELQKGASELAAQDPESVAQFQNIMKEYSGGLNNAAG